MSGRGSLPFLPPPPPRVEFTFFRGGNFRGGARCGACFVRIKAFDYLAALAMPADASFEAALASLGVLASQSHRATRRGLEGSHARGGAKHYHTLLAGGLWPALTHPYKHGSRRDLCKSLIQ